jgi:hypothetical protein
MRQKTPATWPQSGRQPALEPSPLTKSGLPAFSLFNMACHSRCNVAMWGMGVEFPSKRAAFLVWQDTRHHLL